MINGGFAVLYLFCIQENKSSFYSNELKFDIFVLYGSSINFKPATDAAISYLPPPLWGKCCPHLSYLMNFEFEEKFFKWKMFFILWRAIYNYRLAHTRFLWRGDRPPRCINDLRFADDIVLIREDWNEIRIMVKELMAGSEKLGLEKKEIHVERST